MRSIIMLHITIMLTISIIVLMRSIIISEVNYADVACQCCGIAQYSK